MLLPRFINEIEEQFHAAHVAFLAWDVRLSLLTQSEYIGHYEPRFYLGRDLKYHPEWVTRVSDILSTRLITVEELRLTFYNTFVGAYIPCKECTVPYSFLHYPRYSARWPRSRPTRESHHRPFSRPTDIPLGPGRPNKYKKENYARWRCTTRHWPVKPVKLYYS